MKRKIYATVLAAVMAVSLTACGGSTSTPETAKSVESESIKEDASSDKSEAEEEIVEENEPEEVKEETKEKSTELAIEETVVYDENGVKITATGVSDDGWAGPEIQLLIENNSDTDLLFQSRYTSLNGIMVDANMSQEVAAGKKANTEITYFESGVETAGIDQIGEFGFMIYGCTSDDWTDVFMSSEIIVPTALNGTFEQSLNKEGTIAYDADGVKIVIQDVKKDAGSTYVQLYIENNTSDGIMVQARDTVVNGFMLDPIFSNDILPGRVSYTSLSFFETDFEDNGIDEIKDLETKFQICGIDDWGNAFETETVSVTF